MKESLQGRRIGFALRPPLAGIAAGLGIAVTLLDLVSWSGWGVRDTNAIVVASVWVASATAIVAGLSLVTALAERRDAPEEDASLSRVDAVAALLAASIYAVSAALRSADSGAAAAPPLALLLEIAGLIALLAGAALSSTLYAAREWQEVEESVHERHRRRRAAGR